MKKKMFFLGFSILLIGFPAVSFANNLSLGECAKLWQSAAQRAKECLDKLETSQNPPVCNDSYIVTMTQNQVDSCNKAYLLAERRSLTSQGKLEQDDLIHYEIYKSNFLRDANLILRIKR